MEKEDTCCHTLNNLRKVRKSQTAQAQTEMTAPPSGPSRSILDFTSESYHDQNSSTPSSGPPKSILNFKVPNHEICNSSPLPGRSKEEKTLKLHKVTDQLLVTKKNQEEFRSNFSIKNILKKPPLNFSIEKILEKTPELSDSSEQSFELTKSPYSMKKVASNSSEFRHSGINKDQNGKNYDNIIHGTYSSNHNDINDEKLKSCIKLKGKEKRVLDLQSLKNKKSFVTTKEIENPRSTINLKNKKLEDYKISTKIEIKKFKEDTNSKNLQLDDISKIQNEDLSQKFEIARILNWQHDNYINRSSSPHPIEDISKVESSEKDINTKIPTLFSILNEEANYKNGLLEKPWDTEDILIKRAQAFNQTTYDNSHISFSPCNLDGNSGILHGDTTPQETEMWSPEFRHSGINKDQNDDNSGILQGHTTPQETEMIKPARSNVQDRLTLSVHQQQLERSNKSSSRYFAFRDGQLPYSEVFKSFAPSLTSQTARGYATQAATSATDRKIGSNAKEARAILSKIAQEPPTRAENIVSQSVFNRQTAPNIIPPWRPKPRAAIPIPSQKQPATFLPCYSTGRADSNSTMVGNDNTNSAETAHSISHLENLDMLQLEDLHDDIRLKVDKEIDRLHDFNDMVLEINEFHMIPYSHIQEDCPPDLFAGSFAAELSQGLHLYVCKPCDMAGFLKSNFRLHHKSDKHFSNNLIWIRQHYFLPGTHQQLNFKPTQEVNLNHCQPSLTNPDALQEFESIMQQIQSSYFPTKYRQEVAGLITEFFNSINELEVNFATSFKNSRDIHGNKHWIVFAVEKIQQETDPRRFLKEMFEQNLDIFQKSPIQETEVKFVADFARLLFLLFINCNFIPNNYVTMLAVIMNPIPTMNYPESSTGLFDAHHLDLLLNMGAMTLSYKNDIKTSTDHNDLSELLKETTIGIKNAHQNNAENQDVETDIDETHDVTSKTVAFNKPLSENIIDHHQAWNNIDHYEKSSTSSSNSIPSLEYTHHNNDNQALSPRPSTSTSMDYSPQENHFFKSMYLKNAIYINNLAPGFKHKDLMKMCKAFGTIKKVVRPRNFKSNAVIVFSNKGSAKLALKTLNGKNQFGPDGMLGTRLTVQYALKKGLIKKGLSYTQLPAKTPTESSPPPKTNSVINGLKEFNTSGFLIRSMENVTIPTYSNKEIMVKLFDQKYPEQIIPNTAVFISCGLAPQVQLSEGIFNVTNSTTLVSIRNNSNVPINIKIDQLINGTHCHLKEYINNHTVHKDVCLSAYHLKCKTYKRLNQYNDSNQNFKECNLWMMPDNPK